MRSLLRSGRCVAMNWPLSGSEPLIDWLLLIIGRLQSAVSGSDFG